MCTRKRNRHWRVCTCVDSEELNKSLTLPRPWVRNHATELQRIKPTGHGDPVNPFRHSIGRWGGGRMGAGLGGKKREKNKCRSVPLLFHQLLQQNNVKQKLPFTLWSGDVYLILSFFFSPCPLLAACRLQMRFLSGGCRNEFAFPVTGLGAGSPEQEW